MRNFLKRLLAGQYDVPLSSVGALVMGGLAVFLLVQGYSVLYVVALVFGLFSCLSYRVIKNRWVVLKSYSTWFLDIACWGTLIGCAVVYINRPEQYSRPLLFFGLLGISAGVIAVKILIQRSTVKDKLTLLEIVGVGLMATLSISFMYPSLIGMDPWWHMQQTMRIVNEGQVDLHSLPVMYLIVAGVIKVTGWTYRLATIISIAVPVVIANVYLVYLLGKRIQGRKVGLLASLLVAFAGWNVFFIIWTIPNTLAVPFVLGVMILTVKWMQGGIRTWVYALTLIPLVCVLVYTHPIATVWVCMFILLMLGVMVVKQLLKRNIKTIQWGGVTVGLLTIVVVIVLWNDLGYIAQLANLASYEFSPEALGLTSPITMGVEPIIIATTTPPLVDNPSTEMLASASIGESLWNVSGMFIYFMVALAGVWVFLSRKSSASGVLVVLFGLVALGAGFLPMLMGMSLLEHRWWLMAEVVLSLPLAWVFIRLGSGRMISTVITGVAVGLLCFMNLLGLPANMDNTDISQNQLARYSFTIGELEALRYITAEYPGTIGVDEFYALASNTEGLVTDKGERILNISPALLSGGQINTDVVIIRDEVRSGLLAFGGGTVHRLNYDPIEALESQGYKIIYENEDVIALSK